MGKIDLQPALELFRKKREEDKSNIMVKCFSKLGMASAYRKQDATPFVLLDKESRLHFYDIVNFGEPTYDWQNTQRINLKLIENLSLRCDLYDTEINICSQDILTYYQENRDYHQELDF